MAYITDAAREYAKKKAKDADIQNKEEFLEQIKNLSPYEKYKALVNEIKKVNNDEYGNVIYDKYGNDLSAYDEYGEIIIDLIESLIYTIEDQMLLPDNDTLHVIKDNLHKIANDYFTASHKILNGPIEGVIDDIFKGHGISMNNLQESVYTTIDSCKDGPVADIPHERQQANRANAIYVIMSLLKLRTNEFTENGNNIIHIKYDDKPIALKIAQAYVDVMNEATSNKTRVQVPNTNKEYDDNKVQQDILAAIKNV